MKNLRTTLLILLAIAFFYSCQKELSYEGGNGNLNTGTWQFVNNGTQFNGNIDSASIQSSGGTKFLLLEGKSLAGTENFRIRLYSTDSFTVRGYSTALSQSDFDYFTSSKTIFTADALSGQFTVTITSLANNRITGIFSGEAEDSTGAQTQITLGTFSSEIDLSNNGNGQGNTTSEGTLGANPDTCTPVTISGNYKQSVPFSAANTVQVQVNVTKQGTFSITTNLINGVSFSKTGTFVTTGVQTVTLVGNGTPQNEGIQYFLVTYNSSTCTFPLTFDIADPPATGTLGGNGASCTPITPAGIYQQGKALDATNTITVQANISAAGSYNISTNTVNGVTFSATGTFLATGVQSVILKGSGTPTNSGIQNFVVTFNAGTCNFSITFAAPAGPATGTLGGSGGSCTPVTPAGTYTQGAALNASNTITIAANVVSIGTYNITTNTVNGVKFTASGNFTTTGINNVVLTGSGTPTNSGPQTFSVSFGTGTCSFAITFGAVSAAIFSCKIDGVFTSFAGQAVAETKDPNGKTQLYMHGATTAGPNAGFQITIIKNDGTAVGAGTYDEKSLFTFPDGYAISINYTTTSELWLTYSNSILGDMPPFTIIVTSVSATRVKGTFSGSLGDQLLGPSTVFKTITEGVFDLPVQ